MAAETDDEAGVDFDRVPAVSATETVVTSQDLTVRPPEAAEQVLSEVEHILCAFSDLMRQYLCQVALLILDNSMEYFLLAEKSFQFRQLRHFSSGISVAILAVLTSDIAK